MLALPREIIDFSFFKENIIAILQYKNIWD